MSREVHTGVKLRRKDDPTKAHSLIQITGLDDSKHSFQLAHTGAPLTATQLSALATKLKHVPTKLEQRKERASYVGGFSIVKPAELLSTVEGDNKIPKKLAVKIYDTHSKLSSREQELSAKAAVRCYNALDQFATWFKGNGKVYLIMEWHGDKDLFDTATEEGGKVFSTEEVIIAFQKLLHKIDTLHKLTGKPVGDIKPENMIAIYDVTGKLTDIAIVDVESNQIAAAGPWTPQYQFKSEIAATLTSGSLNMRHTIETDCHALATVLAILSDYKTDTRELSTEARIDSFDYPSSLSGTKRVEHIETDRRRYPLARIKNPAASRAIHALYATLATGKLPINENIPFELSIFNLQQDCKSFFGSIRQQQRVEHAYDPTLFSTRTESADFIATREIMYDLIKRLNATDITAEQYNAIKQELGMIKHKYDGTDTEEKAASVGASMKFK
ncbi:MAG: hypothetical protein P1U40_01740 [Coxiellaceae bacterium]|nr:hypothetical protein [Coxiellaceae bacterium]